MNQIRILIVHPDPSARALLTSMLQALDVELELADSDRVAARLLEQQTGCCDVLIVGVDPEDDDGLELLHYSKRKFPNLPVVLLFSVASAERAREARVRGASAILKFPLPATHLRAALAQAIGREFINTPHQVKTERSADPQANITSESAGQRTETSPPVHVSAEESNESEPGSWTFLSSIVDTDPPLYRSTNEAQFDHEPLKDEPILIGQDDSLRQAIELAETIAPTRAPVLIQGESGTGKRLVARALHHKSTRRHGPFLELRCLDSEEADLERDLLGVQPLIGNLEAGKFEDGKGGSLYIDDVAALSLDLQESLLRVLRDNKYEPVGSHQLFSSDVRLIFGTRENLVDLVERGEFRQDLYYRLSVVSLKLPPLRHRGADIERLAEHFRARAARRADRPVTGFDAEALALLRRYHWPGNVQELEAVIERAVLIARRRLIEPGDLNLPATGPSSSSQDQLYRPNPGAIRPLKEALEEPEKKIILEALQALGWNRRETARMLDINRTTLYKKMKKYQLLIDEPVWTN